MEQSGGLPALWCDFGFSLKISQVMLLVQQGRKDFFHSR
jgi:hypothetical protein